VVQEPKILRLLRDQYNTEHVRDVQMQVTIHSRSATLAFAPAYVINYSYGLHQVGSIEILKQFHQAIVPASRFGHVVGERHISPRKAQAAAVATVVAGKVAAGLTAGSAAVTMDTLWSVATVDTAFYAFLAASAAGVAARGYTGFMRERQLQRVQDRADTFNELYMKEGMGALNVEEAHDLWLRADMEWLRWEGLDCDEWVPEKRHRWAERLLREQKTRSCAPFALQGMTCSGLGFERAAPERVSPQGRRQVTIQHTSPHLLGLFPDEVSGQKHVWENLPPATDGAAF
jgi:hypothetical protein